MMLRVNGELVDPNLVEEAFARVKSEAESRLQVSCCEREEEFLRQAEEEVIDSILIAQEAEKNGPEVGEAEVRERYEAMIRSYRERGASWEMLEDLREQMREEVLANLRIEKLLGVGDEREEPGEEELRAFYEEHAEEYRSVPEVRCLHLVKMMEGAEEPRVLLEGLTAIRERLLAGEDFEEVARVESEKSTGEVDLGWVPLDRPTNGFEAVLFSMREGEISPVMVYEQAYHLVKVVEVRKAQVTPFGEVREGIGQRVETERRRKAIRELAKRLRERAEIERVSFEAGSEEGG
ncbi:MAG: peptidylprolyl isomerase [Verrucomicrobiota bacterium]